LLGGIGIVILGVAGCSSAPEIASRLPVAKVVVDGNNAEWQDIPSYVKDGRITVSVQNDQQFLYLCLTTQERQLRSEIMRGGLTLWFDREGGSTKIFGLRFPLGRRDLGPPPKMESGPPPNLESGSTVGPPAMDEIPPGVTNEVEVLGPKEHERHREPAIQDSGIQLAVAVQDRRTLVYEARIPLAMVEQASSSTDGRRVGVGIETQESERPPHHEPPSGGGPPGGREGSMPPPPGGMPGPGGQERGRGGPPQGEQQDPLDFWVTVKLQP